MGPASSQPDGSENTAFLTLSQVATRLRARSISSQELVEECLSRIGRHDTKLNSFITVMRAEALEQARLLDTEASANRFRSPLHGIPIAIKDNIDVEGVHTTAASAVFSDRAPEEDADVIRRLRQAGAVLIGKTNLGELALSASGAISCFGPVRNPWAFERISGGSSSGSAAAVAAGFSYGALGTDTGGSVRIPAAYCGIVGVKPTHGLVSARGILPTAVSFDSCGPMARCVEDAALLLEAISRRGNFDFRGITQASGGGKLPLNSSAAHLRLGLPRKPYFENLDQDIEGAMEVAISVLSELGHSIKDITLPPVENYNVLETEIRSHHRQLQASGYADRYEKVDAVVRLFLDGNSAAPLAEAYNSDLYDYIKRRAELDTLRCFADVVFDDMDFVVAPTVKEMPRLIQDALKSETSPDGRTVIDNTIAFNVYGWPAISLPCGFSPDGLPIGMTITGRRFSEDKLIAIAYAYEQATGWHLNRPLHI